MHRQPHVRCREYERRIDWYFAIRPFYAHDCIPASIVALLLRLKVKSDESPYIFLDTARLRLLEGRRKAGTLRVGHGLLNNFNRDFNRVQERAGKKLKSKNWRQGCFHDLRKTFGTHAAAEGVPMRELQAHMGHSSITTTAEYYVTVEESAGNRLRAVFAESA